ncbi:MAG: quinone oxidoreductase [Proteobacteria bacterium]|nr:quinone oxidoreductase [Pseudomonadota bacterium]
MRAIEAEKAGGPEVLRLVDAPLPEPGPGQIRIRHEAIGLNFIEVYQRTGLYPMTYPARLGQEAAGVVDAVGDGVTRFKMGDRAGFVGGSSGAYAEASIVPAERAVHIPASVPSETAAACLLKGMTAEFLVRRTFHVKQGDAMLVHAAAGGVGSILTQWGHALDARVLGAVGSDEKAKVAKAQGCDEVLIYGRDNVPERVKALTGGKGAAVVYDSVGKATFDDSLASLAKRGMLVSFGNASGPAPAIEPLRLSRGGSLFLTRPTLFDYIATTEELDESAAALFEMVGSGKIRIEIGQRFPLDQVRQAHEALEGRKTTGSTVIVP